MRNVRKFDTQNHATSVTGYSMWMFCNSGCVIPLTNLRTFRISERVYSRVWIWTRHCQVQRICAIWISSPSKPIIDGIKASTSLLVPQHSLPIVVLLPFLSLTTSTPTVLYFSALKTCPTSTLVWRAGTGGSSGRLLAFSDIKVSGTA